MQAAVVFNIKDNVATALADLSRGENVVTEAGGKAVTVTIADNIPFGHKFGTAPIKAGAPVIKYGEVIGIASANINPGDYVHTHNVESARARGDLGGGRR